MAGEYFDFKIENEWANESNGHSFESIDSIRQIPINTEIPAGISNRNHAFVVLGYALDDVGRMQDTLLSRLAVTRTAAEIYDDSKIIVSGGFPKAGVTEADVMRDWLVDSGVDDRRIIKESHSRDTVENVINTIGVLSDEGIESATLITSASHMRRALVLFWEAESSDRFSTHIAAVDGFVSGADFAPGERELIEQDLNRIMTYQKREKYRTLGAGLIAAAQSPSG